MEQKEFHISVRNLVEFIFRSGDIDNRRGRMQSQEAMLEGSRLHRRIQGAQDESYAAEVPLFIRCDLGAYALLIEGRADGIFAGHMPGEEESDKTKGDGTITFIDEIKGMYMAVSYMEAPIYVHQAQAMCYAYIYATDHALDEIGIRMTYCNLDDEDECKLFHIRYTYEELAEWFLQLVASYRRWLDFSYEWKKQRQSSIRELKFPFEYRAGQKKLVGDVYRTIARKKTLFLQAPTGVGKTIATIFPAVKAVGEGLGDRIFYLTAKTVTAAVARDTFALLAEHGYKAKIISLTAKEKLCLCDEVECNPHRCPYAKGHFDRVNDAVFDLLQKSDFFTREEIIAQANAYTVCPFELSLDAALWVDDIVCDYNYVFDPNVCLKRFFQEGVKGDYIFLIDEAHNLVDRSREMYSASLLKEDFLQIKRILAPHSTRLVKRLERCNRILLEMKRECSGYAVHDDIGVLVIALTRLWSELEEFLTQASEFFGRDAVLDFSFAVRNFLYIYELVDDRYVIYSEILEDGGYRLKLFCIDPSENLQKCLDKANAAVFFSATLLPIHYYKSLLSAREDNYAVYAESTFRREQRLLLFGTGVSTKYTRRSPAEFERIARYIEKTISCKAGNYMVFFPSYKLMEQVRDALKECLRADEREDVQILCQKNGMKEEERETFLLEFSAEREGTLAAFCVMGGIFGEGIDLKNDRLIGAIIVGTGLPQISNERELLKRYYDEKNKSGFDYAFRYPGMDKVLQAAGRVIRTAEDRGVILLLDERFLQQDYNGLYPREWADRKVCSLTDVEALVKSFWDGKG